MGSRHRKLSYFLLFAVVVLTGAWFGIFLLGPPDGMGTGSVLAGCMGAIAAASACSCLLAQLKRFAGLPRLRTNFAS